MFEMDSYISGRKLLNLISGGSNATNSSDEKYHDKVIVNLTVVLPVYVIVLVACLIGNGLVCLTILKNEEMKRKRWYYFLMNLSISDMGFALITPVHVLQFARVNMGDIGCKLGVHIIDTFMVTSILTLAYISIDRYICMCFPNSGYRKLARPVWIITTIWVFAVILLCPFSIYCRKSNFSGNSCDCRSAWPSPTTYRVYKLVLVSLWFKVPFLTMIFCYMKIILFLWGKKGERSSIDNDRSGKKIRSIKMMLLATSLFFVSWFPYSVLYVLKELQVGNPRIVGKFWLFVQLIAFANSAWNPFTYCVFSEDFRKGFKKIFVWRKKSNEAGNDGTSKQIYQTKKSSDESEDSSRKTESSML